MPQGEVKTIVEGRGFGFIAADGGPDLFFHFSALTRGLQFDQRLLHRRVEFEISSGQDGRPRAVGVRPAK